MTLYLAALKPPLALTLTGKMLIQLIIGGYSAFWLYANIEDIIDMEFQRLTKEEDVHDRTNAIALRNDSSESSPGTLNKYICKLAEAVLLDHPSGLSLYVLHNEINHQFGLSFTEEEIKAAVGKKGQDRIVLSNGTYMLTAAVQSALKLQPLLTEKLNEVIHKFSDNTGCQCSVEETAALLLKYLYFCFNSNVDNLLSLFDNKALSGSKSFEASAEELTLINPFITWEDTEKDALIYSLIATCYEYCMLTIKKDNILSAELFKGKRFYLDANIIFETPENTG